MDQVVYKRNKRLNNEQLEVLELLYKFRFGTNNLFAEYFGKKDRSFVFNRLKVLERHKYIAKRFDSSYRLRGMPAAYYLLPAGARALQEGRDRDDPDKVSISGLYNEGNRTEEFMAHCIKIFALYNHLDSQYGDDLNFLTRSDLVGQSQFPDPLPDAFFTIDRAGTTHSFFLEVFDDERRFFLPDKKAKLYAEYWANGQWPKISTQFPVVMFACSTVGLCERAKRKAQAKSLAYGMDFAVTPGEPTAVVSAVESALSHSTSHQRPNMLGR